MQLVFAAYYFGGEEDIFMWAWVHHPPAQEVLSMFVGTICNFKKISIVSSKRRCLLKMESSLAAFFSISISIAVLIFQENEGFFL